MNRGAIFVAGALCAPFVDQGMLLWFRPEFTHTIRWAGDPALNVSAVPGRTMMPRNSFEAFTQSVVGQCAAWSAASRDSPSSDSCSWSSAVHSPPCS